MNVPGIHNYYEPLVTEQVRHSIAHESEYNEDFLQDVACLALNQLPARYVRHDADMAFFLSTREREKMQHAVGEAVLTAIRIITERNR